jgi:hypothetical protein
MTTAIFSSEQLRPAKIRWHAIFGATIWCARAMLHFSSHFMSWMLVLFGSFAKIAAKSSGIGSCRSRITFAPNIFGNNALTTRTSGMLLM